MHWFEYILTGFKMVPTTAVQCSALVCLSALHVGKHIKAKETLRTILTPTVIVNTAVISVEMCFPAREKFTCMFKSTIPLTLTVKNAT